jgi:signal transduction histidine kinase
VTVDIWRYRGTAENDTTALARVIAENSAAAVVFGDAKEAESILATTRVRPSVVRACLYLNDGTLFAGYERKPGPSCPNAMPTAGGWVTDWITVAGTAPIARNDRQLGVIVVERTLNEIWASLTAMAMTALVLLSFAALLTVWMAHRLHRAVSGPIMQLSAAVRGVNAASLPASLPPIQTAPDEVGDLVRAFSDMLQRLGEAVVREREASRLKDEFLAAVSHELRTPLNAIAGWVQILATSATNEQTMAKAIAIISRNAKAQTRVIEDLVDISRIVTGKLVVRAEPLDLREPVEAAVDVCRPAAESQGLIVRVAMPDHAYMVNGDHDRLQQIVFNLLSNATKFTEGGGTIDLSLEDAGNEYLLRVRDTGIGIPNEFLPHVFDRFRQADGSMTRVHGGLGLGLAIVKEIALLHGGTVDAESAGRGEGATFNIRLPKLTARESQ